jgi:hypothetical protein
LVELLSRHDSSIGAEIMAWVLFDPPGDAENGARPASLATKRRVLELIERTGANQVVPLLARFVREERRYPDLVILAAQALRQIGFPQDLRPGDNNEDSRPPITAGQLLPILKQLPTDALDAATARRRAALIDWLEARKDGGLADDSYRLANAEARPGDWLLMRNPSPYNLFTDLAPGLFTHVGVVTIEKGSDGRRRMVVVDLPERGTHIKPTNIDVFVRKTRHYVLLRHPDAKAARVMAETAASIIGNESVFDLNFRIENVAPFKGQPKKGKVIQTYCAGLLLLCGQETGIERTRLFPVPEHVAPGNTAKNLKGMGVSFGENFVSPTGPLFAGEFTLVGRSRPMYSATAEIEEAVYNHFSACMRDRNLAEARDTMQEVRLTLAQAAKENAALARLLGQMNNVNPSMDLVAAAKTAAVVENLDRVAYGSSRQYIEAYFALTCGPLEMLATEGYSEKQIEGFQALRQRHADLFRAVSAGSLDRRGLRIALVNYYIRQGKAEIDKRFKG